MSNTILSYFYLNVSVFCVAKLRHYCVNQYIRKVVLSQNEGKYLPFTSM